MNLNEFIQKLEELRDNLQAEGIPPEWVGVRTVYDGPETLLQNDVEENHLRVTGPSYEWLQQFTRRDPQDHPINIDLGIIWNEA